MIADAQEKMTIAEDEQVSLETEGLITDASQFYSPYTETSEGSYDALLDGEQSLNSFWHSSWSDGSVDPGIHYLQVDLIDPTDLEYVAYTFARRAADNDHVTEMTVYGASENNDNLAKADCELLATVSMPFSSNTEVITSSLIPVKGYQYLRFYAEATSGSDSSADNRGYWHCSEFQLYKAVDNTSETTQAKVMGEIFTNLEAAIATAEAEGDEISVETYTTLKEAYDAFIEKFVDPDTLRTAISEAEGITTGISVGTNPGQWSDASVASSLSSLIATATAYDAAGDYSKEQSAQYVSEIEAAQATVLDAAIQVEEGKWYNFRFASEELYDNNGWDKTGASDSDELLPSLFGKLVAVAESDAYTDTDGNEVYEIVAGDIEEVAAGHGLYLIDEMNLDDGSEDASAQFRFISVGDTAYIIQNRATGLFLEAAGTSGSVALSIQPTLWTNSAMGYGKNITRGVSILGEDHSTLHSQLDGSNLVTWENTDVSSNTGFLIEEVEAVASDYDGTEFNFALVPGNYVAMCYPVSVTGVDCTLYGVVVEGTDIILQVLENNTAAAAQPFIVIAAINEDSIYNASAAETNYAFQHGYELNVTAGTSGKMIGTFEGTTAAAGSVITSNNGLAIASSETDIDANSAYINAQIEDVESALNVTVTEDIYNAIKTAVVNATKTGDIYSIDGTKVGTGNLSTVKSLKKGLYIVNGTKVLVK